MKKREYRARVAVVDFEGHLKETTLLVGDEFHMEVPISIELNGTKITQRASVQVRLERC